VAGVPIYVEQILKINAHPRFYIRLLDHFDNLCPKIDHWINRVELSGT